MTRADSSPVALIDQLAETWAATIEVCRSLSEADWARPTPCPGWTVKDQVVHMIGTESILAGRSAPDVTVPEAAHIRNDAGRFNETWIIAQRHVAGPKVLDDFEAIVAQRLAALRTLSDEGWEAPSATPIGRAPYHRFIQIRVFDCWVHEMDIKDALGPPATPSHGAAAEQSLDEVERALGILVGKRAAAPTGTRATLSVTGPIKRDTHIEVNGRAAIVAELHGPATVTLRMDSLTLLRLACGRVEPAAELRRGSVVIEGDTTLGERIVNHLPFTI